MSLDRGTSRIEGGNMPTDSKKAYVNDPEAMDDHGLWRWSFHCPWCKHTNIRCCELGALPIAGEEEICDGCKKNLVIIER